MRIKIKLKKGETPDTIKISEWAKKSKGVQKKKSEVEQQIAEEIELRNKLADNVVSFREKLQQLIS